MKSTPLFMKLAQAGRLKTNSGRGPLFVDDCWMRERQHCSLTTRRGGPVCQFFFVPPQFEEKQQEMEAELEE
jgi:hypothetical protein